MDQETGRKVFRKRGEFVSRKIAGETILVPLRGKLADMQRIFSLNPVAEHVWNHLNGEKTLLEIGEGISAVFEVDRERADEDVREFIAELLREELIQEV